MFKNLYTTIIYIRVTITDYLFIIYLFITIYSIQYKYIMEIKITKTKKSCGEGDNQKCNGTILGMSPLIKI